MKISTQSRYGLRALFDIAYHSGGLSTQVKDISARQGISPRYIEQIFQKLKRAGIVKSIRGPSGGYYLARTPEEIKIGDIIRATEGTLDLVFCLSHDKTAKKSCDRAVHCVARDVWQEASGRLMEYFDSVTLQDLCKQAQRKGIERVIDKHLMYYI
ncbi:MAG TPA: Rrf2 family transcriptional regulator [Syntrophorhabdales bacterium]|nr:Rrf2 family transcriptional regulator [Syntrophorhabdales bacterium]